jgi:hypothetical protein
MNKNSVKYLQGINFSQLNLAKKNVIKNLGLATAELVISQSLSIRMQTYVRKCNPAIYAKHVWLSGCSEKKSSISFSH